MLRIKGPGVFLSAALSSMALVTLGLGILNPGARVSLFIALVVSAVVVTVGYWVVRRVRERRNRPPRSPEGVAKFGREDYPSLYSTMMPDEVVNQQIETTNTTKGCEAMKLQQLTLDAEMKVCQACGKDTPLKLIAKFPGRSKNKPVMCRECKAHGEYDSYISPEHRDHNLRYKFKMSPTEKEEMEVAQDYRCAICRAKGANPTWGTKGLFVDHDHKTGKVRGLLCDPCNKSTRLVENPELLVRSVDYMRHHYGKNYKIPRIRVPGGPMRPGRKRE